jgi:hypothetical protein
MIPFTQYLLPDGHTRPMEIDMPSDVEAAAKELLEKGCNFDAEILTTGEVSVTCELDEELLSIAVCENDRSIFDAVEEIIRQATAVLAKETQ